MGDNYISMYAASLYHEPVRLWCHVVLTTVGGADVDSFAGKGIANVVRSGAGLYRITFADRYRALLGLHGNFEAALDNVDMYLQLAAEAVNTAGGGTIDVRTKTAGVSTDPADQDDFWVYIDLIKSSADVAI
jgi:hypothetical protein